MAEKTTLRNRIYLGAFIAIWPAAFLIVLALPRDLAGFQTMTDLAEGARVMLMAVNLLIFALPLCTILLRAIAAARDPTLRVTPTGPWHFYRMQIRKGYTRAAPIWIATYLGSCLVLASLYSRATFGATEPRWAAIRSALMMAEVMTIALIAWMLIHASALVWAPRCRAAWKMALLTAAGALGAAILLHQAIELIVPSSMRWVYIDLRSGGFVSSTAAIQTAYSHIPLGHFYVVPPSLLLSITMWWWVRSRGVKWLRLEE